MPGRDAYLDGLLERSLVRPELALLDAVVLNGEIRVLVTEQDCRMIQLRRESRPFAFNRSHPGPKERVKGWLHKMFFPLPALPDDGGTCSDARRRTA